MSQARIEVATPDDLEAQARFAAVARVGSRERDSGINPMGDKMALGPQEKRSA